MKNTFKEKGFRFTATEHHNRWVVRVEGEDHMFSFVIRFTHEPRFGIDAYDWTQLEAVTDDVIFLLPDVEAALAYLKDHEVEHNGA